MSTDDTQNNDNDNDNDSGGERRPTDRRPLGYWLRVVDELLTRELAAALEGEGITRRDWMLLNVLAGDVDAPGFRERLTRKGKRLRSLEDRGWVEEQGDGTWLLTDEGRAAKERIGVIVDGLRTRLVDTVGADAFDTTMTSLEAMARELGWDESSSRFGRPWRGGWDGPRPFRPEIRYGWGPNRHHGFEPGRPGHPGRRPDSHGHPQDSAEAFEDGCHGHGFEHGQRFERGHGWGRHGHGFPGRGFGPGHRQHGHHGHGHGHDHAGPDAEQAYERGFDAGFQRGRESGAA